MKLIRIYYDEETKNEATQIYNIIVEIIKENKNIYGNSDIIIAEFERRDNDITMPELPCITVNYKEIHKKRIFGKSLKYTKGYLESQIDSIY